jgi:microcompartment protein CcmK/EutM
LNSLKQKAYILIKPIKKWYNSFVGAWAGFTNTTGSGDAFFGESAGHQNTTGFYNTFFGYLAGFTNTTGARNTFVGESAGYSNTIENANSFFGARSNGAAGITNATALGYQAQVSQSNSLVLGSIAGVNSATESVNVGIGTDRPARQLHLSGPNAVFRMDRPTDTAAFLLVRTNASGNPLKSYVVGTNAAGANNGEFVINDLGTAVSGDGTRRMTITNAGNVIFSATVTSSSSARYKRDIATLTGASASLDRLRGVRFVRVATGQQELGLIAEEVAEVYPELVEHDATTGQVEAVNYSALTAVLLQALKEQQARLEEQQAEIAAYQTRTATLEAQTKNQQAEITELQGVKTRLADLERRLEAGPLPIAFTGR